MVVLDADVADGVALERVLRREVLRVQVVRRRPRGATSNSRSKCAIPSAKACERLDVAQVADVVRDPRARALGDAERALELRAAGQDRQRRGAGQRDARRHVAARAPQRQRAAPVDRRAPPSRRCACGSAGRGAGSRSAMPDRRSSASSSSNAIGSSETLPLVITSGTPDVGEQQVVQRRVRAASRRARGAAAPPPSATARGRAAAARARSAARASAAAAPPPRPSSTSSAAAATSRTISANGLSSRCLRARSAATARSSTAPAREVEAAEPLDRDHPAAAARHRSANRV